MTQTVSDQSQLSGSDMNMANNLTNFVGARSKPYSMGDVTVMVQFSFTKNLPSNVCALTVSNVFSGDKLES